MILYKPIAWKAEEECNFSPCRTYKEAKELGDEYYLCGYDIEEIDTEEED